MAYQSFPGEPGDSDSPAKLKALCLPDLKGKKVLDVGCNAGYFCQAALDAGAASVTGIDANATDIDNARARYPGPTFIATGWDALPEGKFDVILLLSAIHYAEDQPALIAKLVAALEPGGVLILEMGIAAGVGAQWVSVNRGMDVRQFPTMGMLGQVLSDYGYRMVGNSVPQAGDPTPRYVFHVQQKRQALLMCIDGSGTGKSNLCRTMLRASHGAIGNVSLDDLMLAYYNEVAGEDVVTADELIRAYNHVCEAGILKGFARRVNAHIGDEAVVLVEGAVPSGFRAQFARLMRELRHCDVWTLSPFEVQASLKMPARQGESPGASTDAEPRPVPPTEVTLTNDVRCHLDKVRRIDGGVALTGWACDIESGYGMDSLELTINGHVVCLDEFSRSRRADVRAKFELDSDLLGFAFELQMEPAEQQALFDCFRQRNVKLKAAVRRTTSP